MNGRRPPQSVPVRQRVDCNEEVDRLSPDEKRKHGLANGCTQVQQVSATLHTFMKAYSHLTRQVSLQPSHGALFAAGVHCICRCFIVRCTLHTRNAKVLDSSAVQQLQVTFAEMCTSWMSYSAA